MRDLRRRLACAWPNPIDWSAAPAENVKAAAGTFNPAREDPRASNLCLTIGNRLRENVLDRASLLRFSPIGGTLSRLRRALAWHLHGLVGASSPVHKTGAGSEYWRAALDHAGVTLQQVLKVNAHARVVLLVHHPRFGKCVLKASCPICHPQAGFSNAAVVRRLDRSNPGIFPALHAATDYYTLQSFIEGWNFREWMDAAYDADAVVHFLHKVKLWSSDSTIHPTAGGLMRPDEIRFLCDRFVDKCLKHARFSAHSDYFRTLRLVRMRRHELGRRVAWLDAAAENLRLPRGVIDTDLGVVNIVVERRSGGLYSIDNETLVSGHYGFAAAYFISSIFKLELCRERQEELIQRALTEEDLGGPAEEAYFRALTSLLIDIGQMIYRPAATHRNSASTR